MRSILLRGFDQQMAGMIGAHMERMGINFLMEYVPLSIDKDELGKLKVVARTKGQEVVLTGFDTIILAVGREACTKNIGLNNVNVVTNPR